MNARSFVGVWLSCFVLVLTGGMARAREEAKAPPEVPVARPLARQVTDHEEFTGRTDAREVVDLRSRVTGYVLKTNVQEGSLVKKGDVLFEIDPRPYQAELNQAEARLALSEARLKVAETNLKRNKELLANKLIAREEYEKSVAEQAAAEAEVDAAKATVNLHRLNLDFTKVRSPIDGRVGRRLLDPGNLAVADNTILARVISQGSVYLNFDIDEETVLHMRIAEGKLKNKEWAGLPIAAGLASEEGYPRRGSVDVVDAQVNPDTGTLPVRAILPNEDGTLMPGMFVRVRLTTSEPYRALLVPEGAVLKDNMVPVTYLLVVGDGNDKVERRRVVLGSRQGNLVVVKEGLREGDEVILSGLSGLRPGMTVKPKPMALPER